MDAPAEARRHPYADPVAEPTLDRLAAAVLDALRLGGWSLATAESLTGGLLAAAVTAVPGASACYLGGVVSYATDVKIAVLGVPRELVATYGVISPQCALTMARGVIRLTGATYALATTGVAGPEGQEGHPPGTVHVAVVGPGSSRLLDLHLPGGREAVQAATCSAALSALRGMLDPSWAGPDISAGHPEEEEGLG